MSCPLDFLSVTIGNEDRTREVWSNGYYYTGDIAWRDEDGYYWFVHVPMM